MNKMKRVFSLVLVLSMILGSFGAALPVVHAAEGANVATEELKKVPKDVIGTDYEKAVSRLVAFGVLEGYEDGTYKPEKDVTRAEFAKILVEALGISKAAGAAKGQSQFKDVTASHWASGYINVASGNGLIKGFPDGTYKPEDKVSHAEALTMLVRALGYQDSFLKGMWPGSHIAKAAEVGITSGVKFNDAGGFANRGNVAQMVNNTLDSDVVKVETYKDGTTEYRESEKTLLKDKLDISKYEDTRVIADKIVDDGLQEDEITVKFLKEIKKDDESVKRSYDENEEKDFKVIKGVTARKLIGEEVSVYMDDRDNVVYIESENDDRANFDTIEEIEKGKDGEIEEIALVRFDKEYKFDKDAKVYVYSSKDEQYNSVSDRDEYIKADVSDVAGKVGKFVVKNNRIIYAEIMDPAEANPWMLVRKNEKGLLDGINDTIEDFDIDLRKDGDYDGVLVFDTLGNKLDVNDIEKGNIVYVQKLDYDGDDYAHVVVVQDNQVEGKLSKVKEDKLALGDKQLKVIRYKNEVDGSWIYDNTFYSVEGFEDIKKWDPKNQDWEDDMEDADQENMVAYLDATGKVAFLSTEGLDGGAGYKYGVVTRSYVDNDRIKIYTHTGEKDGDEITYKADKDRNLESPRKLDAFGNALGKKDQYENIKTLEGHVVKFKLNRDGEIAEDEFYVMDPENYWVMEDGKDFGKDSIRSKYEGKDKDVKEKATFYVEDRSVIVDAESLELNSSKDGYTKGFDSDDFGIVNWKDVAEDNYDSSLKYYVFTKRTNDVDVDAVVFIGKDGLSTASDEEAIYVISKWSKGGDIFVEYVSFEDGKKAEKEVDKVDGTSNVRLADVDKETPYIAKMKSGNKVELHTKDYKDLSYVSGVVSKRDGNIVQLDDKDKEYRLSNDVVVYDEDVKKTTSNIRVNDEVTLVVEDRVNVRVVRIGDQVKPGKDDKDDKGKVTYINVEEGLIEVDDKILELDSKVRLVDADKNTLAIGPKEVARELKKGNKVEVKESKGIVTEIKLVKAEDKVNRTNLEKAVKKAKALKEADYTAKSFEAVTKALDLKEETQKEVDAKVTAIEEAIEGLEVKEEEKPVIGKITKISENVPMLGATTIYIELENAEEGKEYTVTADGEKVKGHDKETGEYFLSIKSSHELAKKDKADIEVVVTQVK